MGVLRDDLEKVVVVELEEVWCSGSCSKRDWIERKDGRGEELGLREERIRRGSGEGTVEGGGRGTVAKGLREL